MLYPLGGLSLLLSVSEAFFEAEEVEEPVLFAEVLLAGAAFAVVVALLVVVATCGLACSSQWNGSKLVFGSTQDGFLEA